MVTWKKFSFIYLLLIVSSCNECKDKAQIVKTPSVNKNSINISEIIPRDIDKIIKEDYFDEKWFLSINLKYTGDFCALYDGDQLHLINIETNKLTSIDVYSQVPKVNQLTFIASSETSFYLGIYDLKTDIKNRKRFFLYEVNEEMDQVLLKDTLELPAGFEIFQTDFSQSRTIGKLESDSLLIINSDLNNTTIFQNGELKEPMRSGYEFDIIKKKLYRTKYDSIFHDGNFVLSLNEFDSLSFHQGVFVIKNGVLFFRHDERIFSYNLLSKELESLGSFDLKVTQYYKDGFFKFPDLNATKGRDLIVEIYSFQ